MEENARVDKIISQATQWSFEGDCSLLAWMEELSQHIEQRATTTNNALQQLNINVNRTAIALDNAANSLTALQYTQFVESRCHDDDETQVNAKEVEAGAKAESSATTKSPKAVLETFLQKNVQMLHSCHEKYALDFEDSDEDDNANTNNYIYQPKNPYNDALLPHIYGSKLWKEHWHVGLCDGFNEYSGDEASDAFSESSSSSAADNESYESNTANLSEWASSTSIPIEHKHPAQMVAQKEHALPASVTAGRNKHLSSTQHLAGNDDSDTCSTTSRSTTTNPPMRSREHDLFAALRHDTPITSTSTSSSPHQHVVATAHLQRAIAPISSTIAPFFDVIPPTDIFADTATAPQLTSHGESEAVQQNSPAGQIKRKPVNLFDDDDFNSFMTEVVDKAQTKATQEQQPQMPVPASRSLPSRTVANLPPAKTVDLFAEPSSIKTPAINSATAPMKIEKPKENATRKPVNLFDSPEGSPENDSLFTTNDKKAELNVKKAKDIAPIVAKPSITAKSLFDDDDDDDDFLNVFGAKKLNLPQRTTGKTLFFNDDNEEVTRQPTNTRTTISLFDDTPPADDVAPTKEIFKENNNNKTKSNDSYTASGSVSSALQQTNATAKTEAEMVPSATITTTRPSKFILSSQLAQTPPVKPVSKLFGTNLFADDENDDLDDLFNKRSTRQQTTRTVNNEPNQNVQEKVATTKPITDEIASQKKSLFGDDLVDDDDNDLFSKRTTKDDNHSKVPSKASQSGDKRPTGIFKGASLFGDDFDDDADDLFDVKPAKKAITSLAVSKNVQEIASATAAALKDETQILMGQSGKSSVKQTTETKVFEAVRNVSPQKPLFEDDDLEITNNLFSTANKTDISGVAKVNEDSNSVFKEVQAGSSAFESTVLATAVEKERAELKQPEAVNGLFNNNLENVNEKAKKTLTSDVIAEKIATNDEENVENIKTSVAQKQNSTVDTLSTPQKITPNKEEVKESETFVEILKHEDNKIENQLHSTSEHTVEQPEKLETPQHTLEPIDEVVDPPGDTLQDRENTEHNQQKYASIFLDEPPDDDDFFTTLSNNTKPLSVSKITLDLESDFYEPALPQVPNSARSTTTVATTNTQAGTSDYGGLRLFSEIPPDDDDDDDEYDFNSAKHSKQAADNGIGVNQRLHSVFYDDFTETLEAVQQIKENKIAAHALFDDEPPPDEEPFAVGGADTLKIAIETITADTNKTEQKYEQKYENLTNETSVAAHSKDVTDRETQKLDDITTAAVPEKPRAAAGKLQMPNININVQALLPGGGGKPSFKKSPTTPEVSTRIHTPSEISIPPPAAALSKATSNAKSTASAESANESLLPSVCKTRVRAPVGRRPSTRRARQENYRQSLLAEQNDHIVEDSDLGSASSSSLITRKPTNQNGNEDRYTQEVSGSVVKAPAHNAKPANFFLDEDDDADDYGTLFKPAQIISAQASINTKQLLDIKTSKDLSAQGTILQENSTRETHKSSAASKVDFAESDGDYEDDEDDLFKSVWVAPSSAALKPANKSKAATITTTTTTKSIPTTTLATKSLFGNTPNEDSDDDLFKSSKPLPTTATRTTTKGASPITTTATPVAAASRVTVEPKTKTERKLDSIFGSDDEDDDFLSNLKPKKEATTNLLTASVDSSIKQLSAVSSGLFSDIESDEDDLFGAKSKTKQATGKAKAAATTSTKQRPITTKQQPLNKHTTLADNPLADLLNP